MCIFTDSGWLCGPNNIYNVLWTVIIKRIFCVLSLVRQRGTFLSFKIFFGNRICGSYILESSMFAKKNTSFRSVLSGFLSYIKELISIL